MGLLDAFDILTILELLFNNYCYFSQASLHLIHFLTHCIALRNLPLFLGLSSPICKIGGSCLNGLQVLDVIPCFSQFSQASSEATLSWVAPKATIRGPENKHLANVSDGSATSPRFLWLVWLSVAECSLHASCSAEHYRYVIICNSRICSSFSFSLLLTWRNIIFYLKIYIATWADRCDEVSH